MRHSISLTFAVVIIASMVLIQSTFVKKSAELYSSLPCFDKGTLESLVKGFYNPFLICNEGEMNLKLQDMLLLYDNKKDEVVLTNKVNFSLQNCDILTSDVINNTHITILDKSFDDVKIIIKERSKPKKWYSTSKYRDSILLKKYFNFKA